MNEIRVLTEKERNWAMFCHLSALSSFVVPIPFAGIIGPLICWSSKRHESTWVDENGKAALNFQLSIALYFLISIPLWFVFIGILITVALAVLEIVCVIIASVKASKGEYYRYPLMIPFIQ